MGFERVGGEERYSGVMATVRVDRFRHDDNGEEVEREYVVHPGAVAVVAHDGERLWLVRQPREAVGAERLLELPAGKLDGEEPLATARRELAEEIGKGARTWEYLTSVWTSPGFIQEEVHLYEATDLYDEAAEPDEEERIEIETVPIARLDDLIRECRDAKSLVGLLWYRAFRL